jgi:serologically defined colon cancer antigen 8
LTTDLERLKAESDQQKKAHQDLLAQQQKSYDEKMATLKANFEQERDGITAEIKEIEKTKRQAIAELEAETKEWEERYNNREARPEDLERIRKLEELIRERTEAIEKVQQELKHYQSELLNRETAYNKVFNNKPQVSVLTALERKAKRDALIAAVGSATKLPPLPDCSESARKSRPPS